MFCKYSFMGNQYLNINIIIKKKIIYLFIVIFTK